MCSATQNIEKSDRDFIKLRPLISYALSSYSMANGNDYFKALVPLFAPIAKENKGKLFDPIEFCREVAQMYDLHISEHVAKNFITPMSKAGLLKRRVTNINAYRYCSEVGEEVEEQYLEFEKKIALLFSKYHEFISTLDGFAKNAFSQEALEDGLVDWILRSDKKFEISDEYTIKPKSELEFIASRFLQHLEKNDTALFNDIALIHSGAVMSELVLDFKAPDTSKANARGLNIFLDSPFVMQLLNLSGKYEHENSLNILEQLKKLGVILYVFKHSCEEIEGNIHAVLSPSDIVKTGPLASALNNKEVMPDYVRMVSSNLENKIIDLDLKIFDVNSFGYSAQREPHFSEDLKDRLSNKMTSWKNISAKEKDVESIAAIMKWRRSSKQKDFLKSGYLFATNNTTLEQIAKNFCVDEGLLKHFHAPPAISIHKLSGILFLLLGDSDKKISFSRKKLLSSCGRAAIANPDIIDAFNNKIQELSPADKIQVAAILSEPRSMQLVMDMTWGNPDVITSNNVEDAVGKIMDSVESQIIDEQKQKIQNISEQRDSVLNDNYDLRVQQELTVKQISSRIIKNSNKAVLLGKCFITLCAVAFLMITIIGYSESNNLIKISFCVAGLVTLALTIYPLWLSPNWLNQKVIHYKKNKIKDELSKISLQDSLIEFEIDYDNGEVNRKKSTLL